MVAIMPSNLAPMLVCWETLAIFIVVQTDITSPRGNTDNKVCPAGKN